MSPRIEPASATGAEATTLYVAIEISRKSWVVGIKSPQAEKIGLHTRHAADAAGLKTLIEQRRSRAQQALDRAVDVRVCYEAGYGEFGWHAGWSSRWRSRWSCSIRRACW